MRALCETTRNTNLSIKVGYTGMHGWSLARRNLRTLERANFQDVLHQLYKLLFRDPPTVYSRFSVSSAQTSESITFKAFHLRVLVKNLFTAPGVQHPQSSHWRLFKPWVSLGHERVLSPPKNFAISSINSYTNLWSPQQVNRKLIRKLLIGTSAITKRTR